MSMDKCERTIIDCLIQDCLAEIKETRVHFGATVPKKNAVSIPESVDEKIEFVLKNHGISNVGDFIDSKLPGHALKELFRKCVQFWEPHKPERGEGVRSKVVKLISIMDSTLPKFEAGTVSANISELEGFLKDLLECDKAKFINHKAWKSISSIGGDFELSFRDVLCNKLNKNSKNIELKELRWIIEIPFRTEKLRNQQGMSIDIMGEFKSSNGKIKKVSLELKYVTQSYNGLTNFDGKPSNLPGFPYDILKDCIKTEILLDSVEEEKADYGIVIGLTNYPAYWGNSLYKANGRKQRPYTGWAKNYLNEISKKEGGDIEPGIIKTEPRENIENCIYCEERHHISLSRKWTYKWLDYSDSGLIYGKGNSNDNHGTHEDKPKSKFRYIYLTHGEERVEYQHDPEDASCIPFLLGGTRMEAEKITEGLNKEKMEKKEESKKKTKR